MDITMFVIAAAVMAALPVTAVMKKSHVIMVAATTIPLVKMVTN